MLLNRNTIQEIASKNETSEAFFSYLSQRERSARGGENSIQSIKQQMIEKGFNPAPQELLSTLRELERVGVIEIKGDRFRWKTPIRDLAGILRTERKSRAKPAVVSKILVVALDSRRKFTAEFPTSLTKEEARFLGELLLQNAQ